MIKRWLETVVICLIIAACSGCRTEAITDPVLGPSYKPKNVFTEPGAWLLTVRRVAVLPLAYDSDQPSLVSGRETLEPILHTELSKSQHFECIVVTPSQIKKWTNRERWAASERLPKDLLDAVGKETGCDAVLFSELTQFRPYPPLLVGWNLRLVDLKSQKILWGIDETFDASESSVANGARRYQMGRQQPNPVLSDSRQVLTSPRQFGQYTAKTVVATLPEH